MGLLIAGLFCFSNNFKFYNCFDLVYLKFTNKTLDWCLIFVFEAFIGNKYFYILHLVYIILIFLLREF